MATTGSVKASKRDVKDVFAEARASALSKLGSYLTSVEKEALATSGTAFTIKNIEKSGGKFGTKWVLTILLPEEGEVLLTIPDNAFRSEMFPALITCLPMANMVLSRNEEVEGSPYDIAPAGFVTE